MMSRINRKSLAVPVLLAGVAALFAAFIVLRTSQANPSQPADGKATVSVGNSIPAFRDSPALLPGFMAPPAAFSLAAIKTTATMAPVAVSIAVLDQRRQFALGAIETANNDRVIGRAGEVSRYQIMPAVWRRYDGSSYYRNPEVSLAVAQRHWASLYSSFRKQALREPNDFDMYVLWNTRYGYYASRGFNPARLHPVVRDGAQRFANLVVRGES